MKARSFPEGSLVLQLVERPRRVLEEGKLTVTREGPFTVMLNLGNGAYRLESVNGKSVPQTWNATHLKAYHVKV